MCTAYQLPEVTESISEYFCLKSSGTQICSNSRLRNSRAAPARLFINPGRTAARREMRMSSPPSVVWRHVGCDGHGAHFPNLHSARITLMYRACHMPMPKVIWVTISKSFRSSPRADWQQRRSRATTGDGIGSMACGMPVTLSLGEKPAMTWVSRLSRVASAVSGGVRSSGGPPRHPSMSLEAPTGAPQQTAAGTIHAAMCGLVTCRMRRAWRTFPESALRALQAKVSCVHRV